MNRSQHDLRAKLGQSDLETFTFADYLARRRSTYTQEWGQLQELQKNDEFRAAKSWQEMERHLARQGYPAGIWVVARLVWSHYQQAKRKQRKTLQQRD